jgi:hypothetical protein
MADTITITTSIAGGIQTVGRGIAGIKTAFALAPTNIDSSQLPALYSFTSSSTIDTETLGDGVPLVRRTMRVQVAVIPIAEGDPTQREAKCRPLIDEAIDQFLAYPQLGGVAGVQLAEPVSDSGIVVLPEWGSKFIGFEIRLEVNYVLSRTYKE